MHTKTLNWLDFVVTDVFHHSFWLQTRVHWSETALEWCCRVTICQCADVRGCLFLARWKWCLFKRLYAIFSVLLIASPAVTNPGFKNQDVQSSYGHISRRWTSLKVTGHICITHGLGSPLYSISVPEVLTRADVNFSVVSVCVCVFHFALPWFKVQEQREGWLAAFWSIGVLTQKPKDGDCMLWV